MRALLLVLLGFVASPQDAADDQYQYVAGLFEKGLHDRVVKEAASFLDEHPRHAKADLARYRLAASLFELKRETDALPHLRELSKRKGFEFESEVWFRLGQCELAAQRLDPAASAFERVLALDKEYLRAPATWMLGESRFRAKDFAAARKHYASALALAPRGEYAVDATCGLAWCAYRLGALDDALTQIEAAFELDLDDERGREMAFLAGECLLDSKRPKEALEAYAAVDSGPFADAALRGSGFAHAAAQDHARAARAFRAVLERFPESRFVSECALHAGIESLAAGDAKAALEALNAKAAGDTAELLYWRARAQSQTGDVASALASVERALSKEAERDLALRLQVLKGDLLASGGKRDEALAAYERSGSDYALQRAAAENLNAGRPADAMRLAKKLFAQFPQSQYTTQARTVLGEACFLQKDYAGAEAAFRAIVDADPDSESAAHARTRLGWCRYLQGAHADAAALFADAAQRAGQGTAGGEARFMEARSLEAAGDTERALRAYKAYLERHRDHERGDEATLRMARLDPSDASTRRLEALVDARASGAIAAEACFELGERLSAAKKFDAARARYAHVRAADARSPLIAAAAYGEAWCAYNDGAFDEAAAILRRMLGDEALEATLREASAELLVWSECKRGAPDAIAAACDELARACQDEARVWRARRAAIEALKKKGDAARARTLVDAAARSTRDPKVAASVAIESAFLHIDAKDLDRAERDLERARKTAPDDPLVAEAYFFAAEARFDAGDTQKASALYAVAAQNASSPVRDRTLYKQGFASLRAEDFEAAERSFATLVDEHAESALHAEALFLLGEAQFRQREFESAARTLARMLKAAPRHAVRPKALFRLGLSLGELGRWKESADALTSLARETKDFENAAEAELWRGRALAHLSDARGARQAFDRVIALDRGALSAQAHIELGRLFEAGGDLDQALSAYLKVAVLYADSQAVAEALLCSGQVLERQGDGARAANQYKELVKDHSDTRFAATARERLRVLGAQ